MSVQHDIVGNGTVHPDLIKGNRIGQYPSVITQNAAAVSRDINGPVNDCIQLVFVVGKELQTNDPANGNQCDQQKKNIDYHHFI